MILNQARVLLLSGRNLAIQLFKCVMVVVFILLDLNHLHTDQEKKTSRMMGFSKRRSLKETIIIE